MSRWKVDVGIAVGLGGLTLLLLLATNGIGLTYDEPVYAAVSLRHWGWFQTLGGIFRGDLMTSFRTEVLDRYWHNAGPTQADRDMHPPLVKVLSAWTLHGLGPVVGEWSAVRLPAMLLTALAVAGVYLWLTAAGSRAAGGFAALALLTMPRFFGHAHLLALDAPMAALALLTAALFWQAMRANSWGWTGALGIGYGLALATKINALLIPWPLFLWGWFARRKALLKCALACFILAPVVFWALWPWLWYEPLAHLRDYFSYHLQHYPIGVLYFGREYTYAPWHYPLVMTALTTPVVVLLLAAVGVGRKGQGEKKVGRVGAVALSGLCLLVHLGAFMLPGTPKYNGVRLFLPALPFLAVLAGWGFDWVSQRVRDWLAKVESVRHIAHWPAKVTVLLGLLLLLPGIVSTAQVHPYELSYYNALIGGVRGAARAGLEPTYWGDTYQSSLSFFNWHAPPGAVIYVHPPGVVSMLRFYQGAGALRSDLRLTGGDRAQLAQADYLVFHNRWGELDAPCRWLLRNARPAFAVMVDDVPLLLVYDRADLRRYLRG